MLTSVVNKNLEAETVNKVELSGHSTGPVPRENPREEKMVPWTFSVTGVSTGWTGAKYDMFSVSSFLLVSHCFDCSLFDRIVTVVVRALRFLHVHNIFNIFI